MKALLVTGSAAPALDVLGVEVRDGVLVVYTEQPHELATGDTVLIQDTGVADGIWPVDVRDENEFSIPAAGNDAPYDEGGAVAKLTFTSGTLATATTQQIHELLDHANRVYHLPDAPLGSFL
jgi:hypothetical protein